MDDTRSAFQPLLFEGPATNSQILEQIWMPGVHGDVGGGYSSSFLATTSLLLMIDRLSAFCPDLAFDTQYINDTLLPIVTGQAVIINNERGKWGKYFTYPENRIGPANNSGFHSIHPLGRKLEGRAISVRGKRRAYTTSFEPSEDIVLPTTTFPPISWHAARILQEIQRRFP